MISKDHICSVFVPQYAEKRWKDLITGKASEIRAIKAFLDSPLGNGIIEPFMLSQLFLGIRQVWFSECFRVL